MYTKRIGAAIAALALTAASRQTRAQVASAFEARPFVAQPLAVASYAVRAFQMSSTF